MSEADAYSVHSVSKVPPKPKKELDPGSDIDLDFDSDLSSESSSGSDADSGSDSGEEPGGGEDLVCIDCLPKYDSFLEHMNSVIDLRCCCTSFRHILEICQPVAGLDSDDLNHDNIRIATGAQ